MNENETKNQLAVFDSLLDNLASLAADPRTRPSSFFAEVTKFAVTLLDPEHFAVLGAGPQDTLLSICGDVTELQSLVGWSNIEPSNSGRRRLESRRDGIEIITIESNGSAWGWTVASFAAPKVSPFQKEVLAAISEIVSTFVATGQARDQQRFIDLWRQFSINVHSTLDLRQVANHIANDGRLLLNCERVSIYLIARNRANLLAVSSVSKIEDRSELMKRQKVLVSGAAKYGQPIGSDRLPSQSALADAISEYQSRSGFPFLFGMPLEIADRQIGFLLAEGRDDLNRIEFARGCQAVVPSAAIGLGNARRFEAVPLHHFFGAVGGVADRVHFSRFASFLATVALLIAFLFLFQTDFKIRISGQLRPVIERTIYAPQEGIVDEVFIWHGKEVEQGDLVVKLRSPELDLELSRNQGETLRLEQLLDAKNIALNQASSDSTAPPALIGQLSSEISDVEYQLKTLADEKEFLETKRGQLQVASPINGTVITWQADEQLMNKPMRWGDAMISIALENGDWELSFRVPERRMGYLLAARRQGAGTDLDFFFESRPQAKFQAVISSIAKSTELDRELGPITIVACVAPDGDYVRRHGARVIADVDCGKASIGYVWTHELIDSVRRRFVW